MKKVGLSHVEISRRLPSSQDSGVIWRFTEDWRLLGGTTIKARIKLLRTATIQREEEAARILRARDRSRLGISGETVGLRSCDELPSHGWLASVTCTCWGEHAMSMISCSRRNEATTREKEEE